MAPVWAGHPGLPAARPAGPGTSAAADVVPTRPTGPAGAAYLPRRYHLGPRGTIARGAAPGHPRAGAGRMRPRPDRADSC